MNSYRGLPKPFLALGTYSLIADPNSLNLQAHQETVDLFLP